MSSQGMASTQPQQNCVGELAQFFPEAMPIRIPVRVTTLAGQAVAENTIIEYGTSQEVLFTCGLALDFHDRLRLENADGSLDVEAKIVAMQIQHGKAAVAARFLNNVSNWIIKK